MDSISAFDFNNEGDCILANESLKSKISNDLSISQNFTFSYMDLMMLSTIYDQLKPDSEMTEEQMSHLQKQKHAKPNVMPFIDVIDLNDSDKDLVNEMKPKSAIVIGLKGEF